VLLPGSGQAAECNVTFQDEVMFFTFDDPRQFEGQDIWWMSYPKIGSRKIIDTPFGDAQKYKVGDVVRLNGKSERLRKILKIEWHMHRYKWVYIVETSATDEGWYFVPYWFEDKI
jgi:hypothetical protein